MAAASSARTAGDLVLERPRLSQAMLTAVSECKQRKYKHKMKDCAGPAMPEKQKADPV